VEEEQVARVIALQHDMKFVSLSGVTLDPDLSKYINATYAQRLQIVPTRFRDNRLTVAMASPIQREELAQLESWCGIPLFPVIVKESDVALAQQKIYKIIGASESSKDHLELAEDLDRDAGKSKYLGGVVSADVDYLAKRIILAGLKGGSSDIHLETKEKGMLVRYRLDGILQTLDLGNDAGLIGANGRQIVSRIKILCDMDIAEHRRPQDSSFKMKITKEGKSRSVDFRVSTIPTQYGEDVVIRILDKQSGTISMEGLGYPPEVIAALHKALANPTGIFLVTGPTGAGKSSTLYAVLNHINTPGVKTLTVEDPIEYTIAGITQTEVNEGIGNSFARMLRSFLRQDPDNIMVGEIRDLETATISMRAALTGHTVLSTLHTNDATSAVTRLIDMGVEPSLISDTLRCVLAQRLVRRLCTSCKIACRPEEKLLEEFGLAAGEGSGFCRAKGCADCNYTGFRGRIPIVELWIPSREELFLFNRRPDNISLRNAVFSDTDRRTMADDGLTRAMAGETTLEELLRALPHEQIGALLARASRPAHQG